MKYLTKGELLLALGNSADKFTAFLMSPEAFGLTGDNLMAIKVAKQKLDWTNTIDLGLPEIVTMVAMLVQYGVVTQADADNVMNTPDRKDGDVYLITVKAQDDISVENIYGAVMVDGMYDVRVLFNNKTTGLIVEEHFRYTELPTDTMVKDDVANKVKILKEAI